MLEQMEKVREMVIIKVEEMERKKLIIGETKDKNE